MTLTLCKLVLAPAFVVLVSVMARRYGPRVGGVLGGLPVVAGPVLLVIALDHGETFAAEAARLSVLSLAGLAAFVVLCARTPARVPAAAAVGAGWVVFLVIAAIVAAIDLPLLAGYALSLLAFAASLRWWMPTPGPHAGTASRPKHDLLLRAVAAMVMVFAVTTASGALGPTWSGVLAPFPIVTSVLAGFSLAHDPRPATQTLLRGMMVGFFSFATFLVTVSATLEPWGIAGAFLAALAIAGAIQVAVLTAVLRAAPAPA